MKKYLIFIAFLSLVSCKESTFTPQPATSPGQLLFVGANQSDCRNETSANSMSTKAVECATISQTKFEGETLNITVNQRAFCTSKFTLTSTIVGDQITLKAEDTSKEASRCMCNYDLNYTFTGSKQVLYKINYEGNVYNNEPCKTSTVANK